MAFLGLPRSRSPFLRQAGPCFSACILEGPAQASYPKEGLWDSVLPEAAMAKHSLMGCDRATAQSELQLLLLTGASTGKGGLFSCSSKPELSVTSPNQSPPTKFHSPSPPRENSYHSHAVTPGAPNPELPLYFPQHPSRSRKCPNRHPSELLAPQLQPLPTKRKEGTPPTSEPSRSPTTLPLQGRAGEPPSTACPSQNSLPLPFPS